MSDELIKSLNGRISELEKQKDNLHKALVLEKNQQSGFERRGIQRHSTGDILTC